MIANNSRRCSFITFGCKVNQYDTQVMREHLATNGFREVDEADTPSTIIVNTCTVTETAYREARRFVKRLGRENPNARIIVTGCAAVSNRAEFLGLPNVSAVVSNAEWGRRNFPFPTLHSPLSTRISYFKGHTRAFLKVQDGCDLNCSFCIIPSVRGGNVSRKI